MELNSSWSCASIGVNILNSNGLWNKFDDLDNSIDLIDFNGIN